MTTTERMTDRLRQVLEVHFHPETGTRYWLERASTLGVRVDDIRHISDLARFGPMDAGALRTRPIEDFVPQSVWTRRRAELMVVETGGTLGKSSFAAHRDDEFISAYVTPFVAAARRVKFPLGVNWLFIGPSGPHVIGTAAKACARACGAPAPFMVDFDPRWARKLPEDSFARSRYLKHVEAQALNVLATQNVGVLFATPPVLASIADQIPQEKRHQILGIHFGGMVVSAQLRQKLGEQFPHAVQISGYGNTLFGVAPELCFEPGRGIDYFAHGVRLIYQVIPFETDARQRDLQPVSYGDRGQVLAHRLDETQLIINMVERDSAIRVAPPESAVDNGFILDGLRDPQPIVDASIKPSFGLY